MNLVQSIQNANLRKNNLLPIYIKKTTKTDTSQEEGPNDIVQEFQMPRKITLFRVVMERKLGIDWEHPEEELEEADSDDE